MSIKYTIKNVLNGSVCKLYKFNILQKYIKQTILEIHDI